jgi:peptide/nickel transport system substrate-binding protein
VVSCGQPQSQQPNSTTDPDRITIGTTEKLRTLDPADAYEIASGTFLYNMGDRLYTYKTGTTEIIPQLATELPKISADGKTYTIPIRQGSLQRRSNGFFPATLCGKWRIAQFFIIRSHGIR